jgi:hypothetical protein
MTFSEWFGPITAAVTTTPPVDVAGLADKQWALLMGTTITGKQYNQKGQPDTGLWGAAKALRDQIKKAAT